MASAESTQVTDLIREIRQHLALSQEKFAARLGVSFRTVNRWENGRAVPSPMAMKLLEDMLIQLAESPSAHTRDRSQNLLNQYFR